MAQALKLAEIGLYTTDPNPRVGCLIVKNGNVIGRGWHERAGGPHAEINALAEAGAEAADSTVYVTLEPCSHHGKTPPCADALVNAAVSRVVVAMVDPNPKVAGNGIKRLQEAGISVAAGLLPEDAESLNPGFCKRMRCGLPFVRSKLAMSLDGRTAMASGESKWITGDAARADVHRYRARSSAMLTGIGTVTNDDPSLNARLDPAVQVNQPLRVVLDSQLKMASGASMVKLPGKTLVLTCIDDNETAGQLESAGAEVVKIESRDGRVDLTKAFRYLAALEINEVMVESGPVLNGALLQAGLVDEWIVYLAPCLMGSAAKGLFELPGVDKMADRHLLKLVETRSVGDDLRLIYRQVN